MKSMDVFSLRAGMLSGLVVVSLIGGFFGYSYLNGSIQHEKDLEWHTIAVVSPELLWLGEYDPGAGASGWLSTFCLDYGEVPETVLENNATDWSSDATAIGYVDADDTDTDLKSEDPFYFVVRCRFNDTVKDGASWNHSRVRCTLTVTGDEAIAGVAEYNNSASDGDAVISDETTDFLFVNFWWDDGVDGYKITDDGSLDWSITIEAKY